MKETITTTQSLEERKASGVWMFATAALVWALSLLSPSEWSAKTVSDTHEGVVVTEVTQAWTEIDKEKKTISLEEAVQMDNDWPRIQTHGFAQVWSNVAPDFAERLSDKPSLMLCIDASDKKTWLWLTVARLDDFHDDPEYPASKATVLNTHWNKSFWKDGRVSITVEWKSTFIDNLPSANGFTADVVWSYTTEKWLTTELTYFHWFKEGKDMNAVRISVSQNIGSVLKATWKVWIKSDSNPKAYWQAGLEANKNWMWLQFGVIGKGKTRTPIISVRHTF